jgi:hypothetical protein
MGKIASIVGFPGVGSSAIDDRCIVYAHRRQVDKRVIGSPLNNYWVYGHIIMLVIGVLLFVIGSQEDSAGKITALHLGLQSVGSSLTAAGIAGELLFLYVRSTASLRERVENVTKAGVQQIFKGRSAQIRPEYEKRILGAKKN